MACILSGNQLTEGSANETYETHTHPDSLAQRLQGGTVGRSCAAMTTKMLPPLGRYCASWVVLDSRGLAVCELFNEANAQKAIDAGFDVLSGYIYLCRVAKEIKAGSRKYNAGPWNNPA